MNNKKLQNDIQPSNQDINSDNKNKPLPINALLKDAVLNLQMSSIKKDGISGVNTGFNELNKVTSGWGKGELIIISGKSAMGKTAFILSQIANMSINHNIPVALFSLEQTNIQVTNKLISICTDVPGEKIKKGRLEAYEWEQLDVKIKNLYEAPIFIATPGRMTIQELCENARKLVLEKGVKAIFIDYVQLLTVNTQYNENRYSEINYISRELKILARELNVPIVAVSQMNRDIDKRPGYEGIFPVLSDLRDSGTLCDDADVVCFIHRPEYYKITEDERGNSLLGIAELIIAKNRNGSTGNIKLRYKKEISYFQEIDEPSSFDFINAKFNVNDIDNEVPF